MYCSTNLRISPIIPRLPPALALWLILSLLLRTCYAATLSPPCCLPSLCPLCKHRYRHKVRRWRVPAQRWLPFLPRMLGYSFSTPQVPTTLPSLDEFRHGLPPASTDVNALRNAIAGQEFPVYAAHAELEGRFYLNVFDALLDFCAHEGLEVVPLCKVLQAAHQKGELPVCDVVQGTVPCRPGKVAVQA